MTLRYSTDIVIFGGGVAGLWLLNRLKHAGYNTILLEKSELGSEQTLSSQGIIHGGLKYALSGVLGGAANTIATMPQRWRDCLTGEDSIDLRGCELLCNEYYMWSQAGIRSKLKTFLGSKSLQGRVEAVDKKNYPDFFSQTTVKGSLYKLPDFVIKTESLLKTLSAKYEDCIFRLPNSSLHFTRNPKQQLDGLVIETSDGPIAIGCQKLIFAAGKGNQQLIKDSGLKEIETQLRPLNMVFIKGDSLPPVYVHCIGDSFSLTPKLTVTSHFDSMGKTVWYLGGEIAETGVEKNREQQLHTARSLISKLFPWLNLHQTEWDCFRVDRAEPAVKGSYRPDDAYLVEDSGAIVAWPTKLTLAPSLGDLVIKHLKDNFVEPHYSVKDGLSQRLGKPVIASAQWN